MIQTLYVLMILSLFSTGEGLRTEHDMGVMNLNACATVAAQVMKEDDTLLAWCEEKKDTPI